MDDKAIKVGGRACGKTAMALHEAQAEIARLEAELAEARRERDEAKGYWGKFADQARHAITERDEARDERDEMEDNYHAACRSKSRKEVRLQASLDRANGLLRRINERFYRHRNSLQPGVGLDIDNTLAEIAAHLASVEDK